jgi:hypothetical protein
MTFTPEPTATNTPTPTNTPIPPTAAQTIDVGATETKAWELTQTAEAGGG